MKSTKICKICKICKREFVPKHRSSKVCSSECSKINTAVLNKQYYEANKEQVKAICKRWREAHPEQLATYHEQHKASCKKWRDVNRAKCNADAAKYRAAKFNATPTWLTQFDLDYIEHIYIQAKELEELNGIPRHVDHIVPLQGKTVCGLHVPWNLQILTKKKNLEKSNILGDNNVDIDR